MVGALRDYGAGSIPKVQRKRDESNASKTGDNTQDIYGPGVAVASRAQSSSAPCVGGTAKRALVANLHFLLLVDGRVSRGQAQQFVGVAFGKLIRIGIGVVDAVPLRAQL